MPPSRTSSPSSSEFVFVYGTLTDPNRVDDVLTASSTEHVEDVADSETAQYRFLGRATLEGFHRVEGRYLTLAPGGSVDGRLLEVDECVLERLDAYEGVDRELYVRVAVPLVSGDTAWVYVGDPERFGLEVSLEWPNAESFETRVRTHLANDEIVIHSRE